MNENWERPRNGLKSRKSKAIDIPMWPLVKTKGTFVNSSNKPFANKEFKVRMNRTIPQFDGEGKIISRLMIDNHDDRISATTDENGNFEVDSLARNTEYNVMVAVWNEAKNQSNNVIRHFFKTEEKKMVDLKIVR